MIPMTIRTLHVLIHVVCEICTEEAWLEAPKDQAWIDRHLGDHKSGIVLDLKGSHA